MASNVISAPRPTAAAAKPLRQVANVRELLVNEQAKQQLAMVAAEHMKPERMMRLIANAIRVTPKLAECDPLTLLGAMMTSASLGLEPNTPLGHAYLIPFGNSVTFIIGYRGMIDLARRSGHIASIHGDVVYEGDEFDFEYGSEQRLRHRPKGKRENPIYAYAHAKLTDGEAFVVLPWDQVLAIREASQGYRTAVKYGKKDSPWMAHLHEMAAKTAVRNLFKWLPISIEKADVVSRALVADEGRVDFSGYALEPQGDLVEATADEAQAFDPETGEVHAIEDGRAGQQTLDMAPEREAEPVKATPKPTPRQRAAKEAPKPSEADQERVADMADEIEAAIWNEVDAGSPVEEAIDTLERRLTALAAEDQGAHDALLARVRAQAEGA